MSRLIGILGGTFDPIHYGHLRPALEVWQALGLDEIRLIPARNPPHRGLPVVAAEQRLHMARLAAAGQAGFMVDDRELQRGGPSFTLDTLRSLHSEMGATARLCILLGSDALLGFPDWHEPAEVLRLAHLIVMHRPGATLAQTPALQGLLRRHQASDADRLRDQSAGVIFSHPVTQLAISASAIRAMLARGESPRFLLPDAVLGFIRQQGLYR